MTYATSLSDLVLHGEKKTVKKFIFDHMVSEKILHIFRHQMARNVIVLR